MAQAQAISLHIEGMTCGGCVSIVEEALYAVPGVYTVRVSLLHACAHIVCRVVSPAVLADAVTASGKPAEVLKCVNVSELPWQKVELQVSGLSQRHERPVREALLGVEGVRGAVVSSELENARVLAKDVSLGELVSAVTSSGKTGTILKAIAVDDAALQNSAWLPNSSLSTWRAESVGPRLFELPESVEPDTTDTATDERGTAAVSMEDALTGIGSRVLRENLDGIPDFPSSLPIESPGNSSSTVDGNPPEDSHTGGPSSQNIASGDVKVDVGEELPDVEIAVDSGDEEPLEEVLLSISGMSCVSCAGRAQKALANAPYLDGPPRVGLVSARGVLTLKPGSVRDAVMEDACSRLAAVGLHGSPAKLAQPGVILRFSSKEDAKNASKHLLESGLASSVNRLTSSLKSDESTPAPASTEQVGDVMLESENTGPSDGSSQKEQRGCFPKGLGLRRWVLPLMSSRASPDVHDTIRRVVPADTSSNVRIAQLLDEANISYDALSPSDPLVSGVKDASAILAEEASKYQRAFWISLTFTLPIVILTMILSRIPTVNEALDTHVGPTAISITDLISWILATPVQFWCGFRFYTGSWYALKTRRANMDVLIALGTSVAYFFSVALLVVQTIQLQKGQPMSRDAVVFETSALLITIVLLGKWMETSSKRRAAGSVASLAGLQTTAADVVSAPPECHALGTVNIHLVSPDDYVQVNAGAGFPVDSKIVLGSTTVDESMLTGESWPVAKEVGDPVYAGTVNGTGAVVVQCISVGEDTVLSRIIDLVQNAQATKAPVEKYADRISSAFVPVVVAISIVTTLAWLIAAYTGSIPESWREGEGQVLFALLFGMSVLVISCPCALGIATPMVVMVATSMGAKTFGILFKGGGDAIQSSSAVGTVLFDKTGTLTKGKPSVVECIKLSSREDTINENKTSGISAAVSPLTPASPRSEQQQDPGEDGVLSDVPWAATNITLESLPCSPEILDIIRSAEKYSDHPLASAIVGYIDVLIGEKLDLGEGIPSIRPQGPSVMSHTTIAGSGVECTLSDGRLVRVGRPSWITDDKQDAQGSSVTASRGLASGSSARGEGSRPFRLGTASEEAVARMSASGSTVAFASINFVPVAAFAIQDPIREEAAATIAQLKLDGYDVGLVTGDSEAAALAVAGTVGIPADRVVSSALPGEKVKVVETAVQNAQQSQDEGSPAHRWSWIRRLARKAAMCCNGDTSSNSKRNPKGIKVAFVGDGINDAGALAAADVGIAMGSGTQIAAESASVVLVNSKLYSVLDALTLSQAAFYRIRLNYLWALLYNTLGIPLAAGALFPLLERRLPPFLAAVAMGASSICVVLNSAVLRRFKPRSVPGIQRDIDGNEPDSEIDWDTRKRE